MWFDSYFAKNIFILCSESLECRFLKCWDFILPIFVSSKCRMSSIFSRNSKQQRYKRTFPWNGGQITFWRPNKKTKKKSWWNECQITFFKIKLNCAPLVPKLLQCFKNCNVTTDFLYSANSIIAMTQSFCLFSKANTYFTKHNDRTTAMQQICRATNHFPFTTTELYRILFIWAYCSIWWQNPNDNDSFCRTGKVSNRILRESFVNF